MSGIVLFLIITTANANVVLTVNEQSPTELIEMDKSEEITIGISDRESSIEAEYDFTLSAFGGILSSCDANDIAASNIPISDLSSEYLFEFTEEFDGLALISLITNKPMIIDDYEVDSGASIYQIVIFELPGIEYYIAFGGGFVAPVEAEPVIDQATGTSEMIFTESGFAGEAMAMSSWTPPYHYFENPWECPDLSNNNKVDLADFALFAENWLETAAGLKGDFNRDNEVDIIDLNHFALYWLYDVDCPDIIYVKKNTASGDDGESWDTAYDQLYTALSNADSNSQIWVAAGTYYPDPTGLGDSRDAIFTLVAEAEVYGGFVGIENYLDECDPFVNETILSGDLLGNDDLGYFSDNSYNVVVSGIDAVLDGFTVQGGYNADIGDGAGAGIYIYTDMEVKNCVVRGNWSNQYGGGIYVEDAAVVIHNSLIVENMAYSDIDSRDTYGGGVFGYFSTGNEQIDIINCTISNNLSFNDDFVYNGSGVYIYNNNNTNLTNSLVWNNLLYYGSYYYLDNIVANSATVTASFCDYDNSFNVADGGNNMAIDPLFANPATGDYHLQSEAGHWDKTLNGGNGGWASDNATSLCIDAGNPSSGFINEPTPNGNRINMGCYGNTVQASKSLEWDLIRVTDNGTHDSSPQISGNNVAWVQVDEIDGDDEIFYFDRVFPQKITDNDKDDFQPKISGSNIVWTRDEDDDGFSNFNIYLYDGSITIPLTFNANANANPDISGNYVTWHGKEYGSSDTDIYFYDGISTTLIVDDTKYDWTPKISGNSIVWQKDAGGGDFDLYLYNIGGGNPLLLTNNTTFDGSQRIFENNIVWTNDFGINEEIYFYNGSNIRVTNNFNQDMNPDVSDSLVVWQGYDGNDYEIYVYFIGISTEPIQITNNAYDDRFPRISGDNIVWNGYDGNDEEIFMLYGNKIYQITDNEEDDMWPVISGKNIAWTYKDGIDDEIYVAYSQF